jgi:S1-C subfamily serine protease
VVGIDSQVATNRNDIAQADGISLAVPVDTARNVVQQLASHGEVRHSNLGNFGYGIATKTASLSPTDKAVVVAKVAPDIGPKNEGCLSGSLRAALPGSVSEARKPERSQGQARKATSSPAGWVSSARAW